MQIEEKIKILAEQRALGIRRLLRLGNSYAITLPKIWVELHCIEIDGVYYVKIEVQEGELFFSTISPEDIEGIVVKEKKR